MLDGKRLKLLRLLAGSRQVDLAKKIGVSAGAISHWEAGYYCIPITKIPLIFAALGAPKQEGAKK